MRKIFIIFLIFLFTTVCYSGTQQTSSTLASAIITQVRSQINEATAEFWSDAELLQWINDGIFDIVKRTHCTQTTESIDLVTDQIEYTVTTTYLVIKAVTYIDVNSKKNGLRLSSPHLVGRVEDVEEPEYFYDWAGKVGVFPALPSRTTETITLYLVPQPSTITSSENIPTPAPYDTAIVLYTAARAWAKDRQQGKWAAAMAAYEAELTRLRKELVPMPENPER